MQKGQAEQGPKRGWVSEAGHRPGIEECCHFANYLLEACGQQVDRLAEEGWDGMILKNSCKHLITALVSI